MTKVLESVAILALVAMFATTAMRWNELPERYPVHFNASGMPDRWSTKNGSLGLPVIATGLYALLTLISAKARRFNVPRGVNQNAPEVRAELQQFITAVKTVMVVMFAYTQWRSLAVAARQADGLGSAFLPVFLVMTFGVAVFYCLRLRRFRQA